MSFHERLDTHRAELTNSDRALISELLAHPAQAIMWTGEELAQRAGVHPSAVTRCAQRLGYQGFMELRRDLRGSAQRLRTDADDIVSSLVEAEVAALTAMPQYITQAEVDHVADTVAAASTIYVYGHGNSVVLAELTARRLRRFGFAVVALTGSARDVAEHVLTVDSRDVVIAFAFRKPPTDLATLLRVTSAAHSIVITDLVHVEADTTVFTPRAHHGGFSTLSVPMAVVNATILTIAKRHPDVLATLDRLDAVLAEFSL